MAPDHPHPRTQEQSIKARKHQLFETDEAVAAGPRQSFAECLRQTPAAPLSGPLKAGLWAVGTLVIFLLAAALATSGNRKPRPGLKSQGLLDRPASVRAA